jgi:anti-anti-sigma regulatory factor
MAIDQASGAQDRQGAQSREGAAGKDDVGLSRARVRPAGVVDSVAGRKLHAECVDLLERGATHVILDLGAAAALEPSAIGAIAAVDRRARQVGSRLSIELGNTFVAAALARSGLLQRPQREGAREVFFDWSR